MTKNTPSELALYSSPEWTLFIDSGRLFASAGADEMYLIEALEGSQAQAFLDAWRDNALEQPGAAGEAFAPVIARLIEAGALFRGSSAAAPRLTLGLHWCGEPLPSFQSALFEESGSEAWSLVDEDADLHLVVRANGSLAQAAEIAAGLQSPHLLVDVAYHHTLSLGPVVKRGQTACLACLAGRITRLWGDACPPRRPAMFERLRLAASLTALQVQKFQRFGTCPELIERLWSMDLNSMTSRFDALHRLPWCPQCFPGPANMDKGRVALPWT